MFDKYTYKIKFQALCVIFVMLCYTSYKRSFSSTIALIKANKEMVAKTNALEGKSGNIESIKSELETLDKLIGQAGTGKEKTQQDIINFTTQGNSVSIHDIQPIHEYNDENYKVYTNKLDVTGNINPLLSLCYDFEKNFEFSRLVSVEFYTDNKNNAPDKLHLKMIFQNYENNK